ncbi:MAG: response regulator [Vicinamibacterales bacterium]
MPATTRVLIVEDDSDALCGYVEFLTAAGFEATGLANGAAALLLALENPPAAVVTDITLPGLTGFELAAALRADPRTRRVPIIGLTAHWTADVHSRARKAAMQVVLSKPCIPGHLLAEIERVLGRSRALDSVGAARPRRMALPTLTIKHALSRLTRVSGHGC